MKYLTPSEAAPILRVDRHTVYTWVRQNKLPAKKVGRGWLINYADIEGKK